jgi:hypothetical protein
MAPKNGAMKCIAFSGKRRHEGEQRMAPKNGAMNCIAFSGNEGTTVVW